MSTIYIFESDTRAGLFAFAGDPDGSRLPERLGPWQATGNVAPGQVLPHRINRGVVETAIEGVGFQMWRKKKRPDASS